MKTLKLIIFALLITAGICCNAQDTQEFDQTIDKLIPKAKKNKLNEKQLNILAISYHEANEIDHKRIMKLKESGQPEIWIEIYHRLNSINSRQNKIKVLPNIVKTAINFKQLNLENEIYNSREKAELFIYAKTKHLLKDINEENLKEAHWLVNQLRQINPQNSNIDELMIKLAVMPNERIIFIVTTSKELHLPDNFAQLVLDFDANNIYGVPFDIVPDDNKNYDLMINIAIDDKFFSPKLTETVTHDEKKDDLVAKVTDYTITKSAHILGKIEIIDVKNKQVLINIPIDIASYHKQNHTEIAGDAAACTEETLQLSKQEVIDFPSDNTLLKGTARELNNILKNIFQEK